MVAFRTTSHLLVIFQVMFTIGLFIISRFEAGKWRFKITIRWQKILIRISSTDDETTNKFYRRRGQELS